MINLNSTSEVIRLVTGGAYSTDVSTDYLDTTSSGITIPSGINDQNISTATTTTIIAAPASSTTRKVYGIRIFNRDATHTQTVTIQRYNGTTAYDIFYCNNLLPNNTLVYDDANGEWSLYNASGILSLTGVSYISGTASQIDVSANTGVVTVSIDSGYVGQTSITTLGTITTGTWNATTIAIANGGTGQTTATAAFDALSPLTTQGDVLYYNGTHNVRLAAGTSGAFLQTKGNAANPIWETLAIGDIYLALPTAINAQTGTTYTFVLGDAVQSSTGTILVTSSNTSAQTFTVPPNSSVAYPTGSVINVSSINSGLLTLAAGAGVTLNTAQSLTLRAQYSMASLIKTGTNTWTVWGDMQ